jgi:hypothetical protein
MVYKGDFKTASFNVLNQQLVGLCPVRQKREGTELEFVTLILHSSSTELELKTV